MKKQSMHDWTLSKIDFDWHAARVTVEFRDSTSAKRTLIAEGAREFLIPKAEEWGPSVSFNGVLSETEAGSARGKCLELEMQSGDVIRIVAQTFDLLPP